VHLAEAIQTPCIVLSDQEMGQARAITDRPADAPFRAERLLADIDEAEPYRRYADTPSGISPAAVPGMPGGEHTAEGLEHAESGLPSAQASDHHKQLDKRLRKLTQFDYGAAWADIEGDGEAAVLTWGSATGPAREAIARLAAEGKKARLVAMRLISPIQPGKLAEALKGVTRLLILEQTHGAQFHKYLRAHVDLPGEVPVFNRPGPLPIRAREVHEKLVSMI
jgi:2-oxoglutarate ferredoxin oxidoreductase subunit alpha